MQLGSDRPLTSGFPEALPLPFHIPVLAEREGLPARDGEGTVGVDNGEYLGSEKGQLSSHSCQIGLRSWQGPGGGCVQWKLGWAAGLGLHIARIPGRGVWTDSVHSGSWP